MLEEREPEVPRLQRAKMEKFPQLSLSGTVEELLATISAELLAVYHKMETKEKIAETLLPHKQQTSLLSLFCVADSPTLAGINHKLFVSYHFYLNNFFGETVFFYTVVKEKTVSTQRPDLEVCHNV